MDRCPQGDRGVSNYKFSIMIKVWPNLEVKVKLIVNKNNKKVISTKKKKMNKMNKQIVRANKNVFYIGKNDTV